ncbi:sigma-54-dependent transcriptional regulator [Mangrovicoccus algicola]|uniref:Sigma-54-dependent Fis family transcriptional regulator n=1 Tax=Mangrovicoccus algicola TaxID=2771008 RepID=A0A8J6Z6Z9_9RHOB|nr:sigma-54 dependent transcriptional regulator [Mangrovicoccus algicola]MBE3639069.1 sigma-54-dependent Fis family transcriptional regulator [Mangrovicoccus algicola]
MSKQVIKVAIVDDEADMRQSISQWLSLSGFETETFPSAVDALAVLRNGWPGVVVSDIKMPGMDGMTFLKRLMHVDSGLPVIMITGHGDVPMAVEAMRIGAMDFMEKPFDPERLTELVRKGVEARRANLDNRALREELSDGSAPVGQLAGNCAEMVQLREDILDFGQSPLPVLIEGETGTGKTLVARALHAVGPRAAKPLQRFFCASISPAQQAAALFGDEAAAAPGLLAETRGGTLILEDVEALDADAQVRLVSWLDAEDEATAPRIIAISNLQDMSEPLDARLRPDLFHRLSCHRLGLPPLRARGDDILTLFNMMMRRAAEEYGCDVPDLSAQDAAQLMQAPWPGNLRQLSNMADRAVLQARREKGTLTSLLMADNEALTPAMTQEGKPLKEYVESFEKMLIDNTMRRHRGSVSKVMEELCVPRRTLNEKMQKYGLARSDYIG